MEQEWAERGIEAFRSCFDVAKCLAGKKVFLVSFCRAASARLVA